MTALQFHFASGDALYSGVLLSSAALALAALRKNRGIRFGAGILAISGPVFAILASNPTPRIVLILWAAVILATVFLAIFKAPIRRRACTASAMTGIVVCIIVLGMELPHRFWRGTNPPTARRLYVIGDSLSAYVGDGGNRTWPRVLAWDHGVELVDLTLSGSTTATQLSYTRNARFRNGMVIIEIGGNDMFTKRPAADFAMDLEKLIVRAASPTTRLIMFELPLFPFYQDYALAQRRLAAKYDIALIPRRTLASLLISPGATISDGIHLTQAGQKRMAELMWGMVGHPLILFGKSYIIKPNAISARSDLKNGVI